MRHMRRHAEVKVSSKSINHRFSPRRKHHSSWSNVAHSQANHLLHNQYSQMILGTTPCYRECTLKHCAQKESCNKLYPTAPNLSALPVLTRTKPVLTRMKLSQSSYVKQLTPECARLKACTLASNHPDMLKPFPLNI